MASRTEPRRRHHKRSAYEPAEALLGRSEQQHAPKKRPLATTLGACFVITRALVGVLWIVAFSMVWNEELGRELGLDAGEVRIVLVLVICFGVAAELALIALGWMLWRGSNFARVLVMLGLTLSILTAATTYFADGQEIRISTTLVTLSLDILVLLALSSRDARAWSRYRVSMRKAHRRSRRAAPMPLSN